MNHYVAKLPPNLLGETIYVKIRANSSHEAKKQLTDSYYCSPRYISLKEVDHSLYRLYEAKELYEISALSSSLITNNQ